MKRIGCFSLIGALFLALGAVGCMDRQPAPVCPVPTELSETEQLVINFEGIDMLLVVDNSGSMAEEQERLATDIFKLVGALTNNPDPEWEFPDATDVHIAVVSTNIGLQYGLDGTPAGDQAEDIAKCSAYGDDGQFQKGKFPTINLETGEIPCDPTAELSQCPVPDDADDEWVCRTDGSGDTDAEYRCYPPAEQDTDPTMEEVECPGIGSTWAETPNMGAANEKFSTQVACMTSLGTKGCGIEQQLQAVERGLAQGEDAQFIRPEALLAIIVLSDEEDCSVKSKDIFDTPEFVYLTRQKRNTVCELYGGAFESGSPFPEENGESKPNYLFDPRSYAAKYAAHKNGFENAVVFAAIVGVPPMVDGEERCEGLGNQIGECLDHTDMQYQFVVTDEPDETYYETKYACRNPANAAYEDAVTSATPGRRYVELAQEMGDRGYIYSICNNDWSPAMNNIADLIATNLSSSCYPKPLDWLPNEGQPKDAAAKIGKAKCHVVVEYINDPAASADGCPIDIDPETEPLVEEVTLANGTRETRVYCALPRLEAPRNCADVDIQALEEQFGWFYCEDDSEIAYGKNAAGQNSWEDGIDNDHNGLTDCEDPSQAQCNFCDTESDELCAASCRFAVRLTKKAQDDNKVRNHRVAIQCLQRFTFEDPNCQENTFAACNDQKDNDGSGVMDCNSDVDEFLADGNCCPIIEPAGGYGDGEECQMVGADNVPVYEKTCGAITDPANGGDYPDACKARARDLNCFLPAL